MALGELIRVAVGAAGNERTVVVIKSVYSHGQEFTVTVTSCRTNQLTMIITLLLNSYAGFIYQMEVIKL